jgi:endonuclease YncB( thermonuclease family)
MADISETYNSLKDRATAILDAGKQRAALALERERVQTYWEVGDVLHAHLLAHKDRAGYGEQTVARLARDLSLGERRLYEMLAHKLRLRGIDTPEMSTKEGKHARTFVRRRLSQVPWVVITTWRPDRYGRYLSDVFFDPDEKDPHVVAREGKYLNGELLKAGLAVRY